MNLAFVIYPVILVAILAFACSAIRVMREYQRAWCSPSAASPA